MTTPRSSAPLQHAASVQPRPLDEVPVGATVIVASLSGEQAVRWRLLDLGLVPGTVVEVLRRSPLGDPTVYGFRGTMVALRRRDARGVLTVPHRAPESEFQKNESRER